MNLIKKVLAAKGTKQSWLAEKPCKTYSGEGLIP